MASLAALVAFSCLRSGPVSWSPCTGISQTSELGGEGDQLLTDGAELICICRKSDKASCGLELRCGLLSLEVNSTSEDEILNLCLGGCHRVNLSGPGAVDGEGIGLDDVA